MLTKDEKTDIRQTLKIIGLPKVRDTSMFWNGISLRKQIKGYVTVKDVKYYALRYIVNSGVATQKKEKYDARCE